MKGLVATVVLLGTVQSVSSKSVISNIIVLMMENRSFDHLLGWLKTDYDSKIDGLVDGITSPRDPKDPSKGELPITRAGYDVAPSDPPHGFEDIATQINSNGMDGFIYNSIERNMNETNPVNMFDKFSAPIINSLAMEYAVFDQWFCSVPGPTDPNRAFAMSGTSGGIITNFNGTLWSQQSYFDYLRQHGRSSGGYYQKDLWALYYFQDTNKPENSQNIKELDAHFYKDVAAGKLPQFTWLQPQTTAYGKSLPSWQHPDASVLEGERLIKKVYEAIRAGPKWEETLFIITYDEHGGFYDHVAPPSGDGIPAPDDNVASNGFKFNQLGVRIPTIAISPWIPKGTIVSEGLKGEKPTPTSAFDATSILATSNKLLGLDREGIAPLGDRMGWANTFAGLLEQLESPRTDCPVTLSGLPLRSEMDHLTEYIEHRKKPLNDHLEAQLLFFCVQNYPTEHAKNECSGRPELMLNQGLASDWLAKETKAYKDKLMVAEAALAAQA